MSNTSNTQYILSPVGFRAFLCAEGTAGTAETVYTEIKGINKASPFSYVRDYEEIDVLNNGGWKKKAALGQYVEDITLNLVREEKDGTYKFFKDWQKNNVGKNTVYRDLVYFIPNETDTFDVEFVTVGIKKISGIAGDPQAGQKYDVNLTVTGGITYGTGTIENNIPTIVIDAETSKT